MSSKWAGRFVSEDVRDITNIAGPSVLWGTWEDCMSFVPLKSDKHVTCSDQENESEATGVTSDLKHRRASE